MAVVRNLLLKLPSMARPAAQRFYCDNKWYFPDPLEHATGINKKEMQAYLDGNCDPYFTNARKRGPGTKDNPNIVPSVNDERIIGCVCHPDDMHVNYMWCYEGYPERCECGYWFKLERVEPFRPQPPPPRLC